MVFKDGRRTYFVIPKKEGNAIEALIKANKYLKAKRSELEIVSGKMLDDETVKVGCKGEHWVIYRRGKNDL